MLKINRNLEIALATIGEIKKSEKPVRVQDIAEKTGAPRAFLDQVVCKLTKHGITKSHRGPGGGITVAKEKVNVLEVAVALGYVNEAYGTSAASNVQAKIQETLSQIEI